MEYEAPTLCADVLGEAHTLIAGCTGSGKSVLLNSLLYTATLYGNRHLILIDPKRVELGAYKPIADGYACELDDTINLLNSTIALIERRYKQMAIKGQKQATGDDFYLCIDELADLLISERRNDILKKLQKLLQLGRAAKIHLIACTQVPNRKIIPAELTLNFTCKIGLRTDSRIESRQIIGVNGCETLDMYGTGYVKRPSHPLELWRIPFTADADIQKAVQRNLQLNS